MRRALVVLAVLLLLFFIADGLVFGPQLMTNAAEFDEKRARFERDRAEFAAQVEADERRWRGDWLLTKHDGRDAAPLLSQHIGFERAPDPPGIVPLALRAAIVDAGTTWMKGQLEVASHDTRWMSELSRSSFWDTEGPESPLWNAPFDGLREPFPNFVEAQWLAKVRLLQGLQSGAVGPAIDDTNELARLCLTTESLVGEQVGVAVLGSARRAHAEAMSRGLDAGTARVLSEDELASLKRVLWAEGARVSMFGSGSTPPLTCGATRELTVALYARPFSSHFLPKRFRELDAVLEASPCRLRRLRLAWARRGEGEATVTSASCAGGITDPLCDAPETVFLLPLAKSVVGAKVAALAEVDWYKLYRDAGTP